MSTVGHAYLKIMPSLQGLGRHLRDQIRTAEAGTPAISFTAQVQTALLHEQLRVAAREGDQTAVRLLAELDAAQAETRFAAMLRRLRGQDVTVGVVVDRSLGSAVRGSLALARGMGQATAATTRATVVVGAATLRYGVLTAALANTIGVLGGLAGAAGTASGSLLLIPAAGLAAAAVMQTLRLGTQGFTDALAEEDPAKFAEAVAKMPPAMRATAEAVRALGPQFAELRLDVQQRLFAGLAAQVGVLGGRYLPILRTGTTGIADALNGGADGIAAFLAEARTARDVATFFDNSADAAGELVGSIRPLLQVLRDVAVVGSGFLPGLASGFTESAQSAAAFIAEARRTGQLQAWMSAGLSTLGELAMLFGNLFGIVGAVFTAANTSGASLLGTLNQVTGAVLVFLRSAQGQTALEQIFGGLAAITDGLMPVLLALGQAVVTSLAPAIALLGPQLGTALASLAPAVGPLAAVLAALAPLLGVVAQAFATILVPAARALEPVVAALAPALAVVAELLAGAVGSAITALAPAVLALVQALAPLLVQLGGVLADALTTAAPLLSQLLTALTPIISAVGGAFLQALTAVLPVVLQLAQVFGQVLLVALRAVQPVLPIIVQLVQQLAGMIAGALTTATPTLVQIGQLLGQVLVTAVTGLAPSLPVLAQAFITVIEALLPLVPPLLSLVDALLPPLTELVLALVPVLVQAANTFATVVRAIAPLVALLAEVLIPIIETLLGVVENVFGLIGSIIQGAMRYVQGVIDTVLGLITGDWDRAWSGVKNVLGGIWDSIKGVVTNGIQGLLRLFVELPGRILSALGDLGGLLVEAGKNIIRGLIRGLEAAWQWIKDKLSLLTDLLPDWKGPPARDRVLLAPTGRMIMGGFLRGLEDGTPQIRDYLGDLTDTLPPDVDQTVTVGGRPRAGRPGVPRAGGASPLGMDAWEISAAVTAGVLAALDGARLRVDGSGVARLVNTANARNARR